jgi:hypothetical protein
LRFNDTTDYELTRKFRADLEFEAYLLEKEIEKFSVTTGRTLGQDSPMRGSGHTEVREIRCVIDVTTIYDSPCDAQFRVRSVRTTSRYP